MESFLGRNLINARNKKRLTQRRVAELVHVAPSTWSLYESDNREPSLATFKIICEELDVSADYLLGFKKEMKLDRGK